MKNFAKLFVVALAVALIAAMFAVSVSAEPVTAAGANPNDLKPGSDKVIFIKDAPRDENMQIDGELEGDGTGSDAKNPLKPSDHEQFDPTADYPKWHLQTAFFQATEMLMETGGTIVICGPVYFGVNECYGSGSSVRDVFTAKFQNNVIKFTSVYDGVDYRKEAGAKITIEAPAMLSILGSTIWENIDFETVSAERAVTFDEYCTLVGEGVNCYPSDDAFEGVASNYISLGAGHRYGSSDGENPTLLVKSGTYNKITGGQWGTVSSNKMLNANTFLTLEGTTKVLGQVFGTVQNAAPFSGNVNITINGGTYECDINGVGPTGMENTDGIVKITINGGDFKNAWSIAQASMGAQNNRPAVTTLDFSGWTGDKLGLAYASAIITEITDVKYPAGITKADLEAELAKATPTTEAPETTTAPTPAGTEKPEDKETAKPAEKTEAPETKDNTPVTPDDEKGGMNIGLIIGIVAAVVVIAVIAVVVLKKKK